MTPFCNIFICFYDSYGVHAEILYPSYRNSGEMFSLFYSSKVLTCAYWRHQLEVKCWAKICLECVRVVMSQTHSAKCFHFILNFIQHQALMSMGMRASAYHVCIIHFMSYLCLCRYNIQNNGIQLTPHSALLTHLLSMNHRLNESLFHKQTKSMWIVILVQWKYTKLNESQ